MGRKKNKGLAVHGWVNFDKPVGMGSTQAVAKVKWLFQAQKAGHAGTLDPLAGGVLPIALGEATKTVPYLMDACKTYHFVISWGVQTATEDAEGDILARSPQRPSLTDLQALLPSFLGEVDQTPPAYSAIKIKGQRAYDLARSGQDVTLSSRKVRIDGLEILQQIDRDHTLLRLDCGKGVYVRSLARDIAEKLGVLGHVSELTRIRVGQFQKSCAFGLEKLSDLVHKGLWRDGLIPIMAALDDIPGFAVTADETVALRQGQSVLLVPDRSRALTKPHLSPQMRECQEGTVQEAEPKELKNQELSGHILACLHGDAVAICKIVKGHLCPVRVFQLETEIIADVDYA